ncbi:MULTISPECIES: ABC transporter ATP-binding protein [unclassified Ruegeria]|uniref:ABC transporter ATP-binding protein n=1 Tax=unclassified Ruegeria TaxID=2625375 RepID=UPI001487DD79|nr:MULTISPECIES: ATP-binding cassette domain-containing protein [unclassified Ruegeria]
MITINDLSVKYGGVVALDSVTLTLRDDVTGLIGPNGAGKTTMTNAFSGFAPIAGGEIVIDGLSLLDLPPHKRARWGLARSFQKVQIVDDLTVEAHLHAVCDTKKIGRHDRSAAIDEVFEFVRLSDQRTKMGADLNPYEKRMCEIAKCLIGAPKIILLDEPGGGLSESEMQDLRRIIRETKTRFGAQIIMVDHDVDLVRDVCQSTAVLDFGRLIAFGPTNEVLQDEAVKTAYLGR